ncbi:MAG: hypothetical protein GQ576_03500, partial [Methanococcoides sp.]|nr:hypothetical protein [Methanococcoides sp.]
VHYPVYILADENGVPYKSLNGSLNVHQADVHTVITNELFHRHTGISTTVSVAAVPGDTSIDVVSVTGFAQGNFLELENGSVEPTLPVVTDITGTVITLDRPLDQALPIGADVHQISVDMNVVGSLASPIIFSVEPDNAEAWHIVSFILSATFITEADDSKFGNLPALENGCTLRGYNGTYGVYRTFTNWKTNSDIKLDMYDLPYTDKSGGGLFGMNGNGDIRNRTGVAPHINATAGDKIELWIQDDLSGLSSFKLKAQGHIEGV